MAGLVGRPGSPRNLLSRAESMSHLHFWGLQLLPYVGCLCLRDPSHINVIIRVSIYTDFPRARREWITSSLPALLVQRWDSLHSWGHIGRGRGGERNVAETEE